jgi:hypothetical protein
MTYIRLLILENDLQEQLLEEKVKEAVDHIEDKEKLVEMLESQCLPQLSGYNYERILAQICRI